MKKKMFLLLGVVMIMTFAGCGCGRGDVSDTKKESETGEVPITTESQVAEEEITFNELTVVDNEACMIKITGIVKDNTRGYTLKANLENKSTDKTYMFSVETASVNGVMMDPFFASEVAPGKKANEGINFSDSTFEKNGIKKFTDIELSFRVYDSNDWTAEPVAKETVHVYPYGEAQAEKFVREVQNTDKILVDNEYVTVVMTKAGMDHIWGYTLDLYLVNKTDKEIMFSVDEASVNGYMADPFYAASVSAGKTAFSSMSWTNSILEENDITNVSNIEFLLRAYDNNDWTVDDFVNETILLEF